MSEFVAGVLAGAIMGLAVQAYWLIALSRRPPKVFANPDSQMGKVVVFGGLVAVGGWMLFGGLIGVLVGAVRPDNLDAPLIPSAAFLFILVFLAAFVMVFGITMLRNWKRHVLITYLLFIGLFGLLLPNLVVAVQD